MRLCLLLALTFAPAYAALSDDQRKKIDEITGAKGAYTTGEDVHRVSFPRNDVRVAVDGWAMHPFMGLTSWAAFTTSSAKEVMVMGDLTLFEDEVNPVMSVALNTGLEVTALHNHFFYDSPRVMFMHIGGEGRVEDLARSVRKCVDKVREIRTAAAQPAAGFGGREIPAVSRITVATIEKILGVRGQTNGGMFKATIGRQASMHGRDVGSQMGVNTWAAFAGSDESAFVDGDFAMTANELQAVLKALRGAGINIVAIHNHMTHEEPHFVFLHYWGKGPAPVLARGLKNALEKQQQTGRRSHPSH